METAGVTQRDVAETLGLSQAAISRKINGKAPWRVPEVRSIASLLGVDPADVFRAVSDEAA